MSEANPDKSGQVRGEYKLTYQHCKTETFILTEGLIEKKYECQNPLF
jgi:hypothetical protein